MQRNATMGKCPEMSL